MVLCCDLYTIKNNWKVYYQLKSLGTHKKNMAMKTPNRQDMRRRSILNASGLTSSAFRRSLAMPNTESSMEPIDEEKERSARRSFVAIQKRLTNISSPSVGSPSIDAVPFMEESQIQDHLKICAKLFTENKISSKNAWKLQVIDVMRKVASTNNDNVLLVAGTNLDIGAKVYGLRVDDVHAKSLQLASSMNKTNEKQATAQDDNGELNDTSLNDTQTRRNVRKKTKKMARDKRNTVDTEEKTLYASIKHVESAVFATKESIDVCATDNLFTQKLPTNPGTRQLMLMNDEKYWLLAPDTCLKGNNKALELNIPSLTHHDLCIPFKDFEIGAWDPEEEERFLAEQPSLHDVVLDEQGLPIAELDGSIHDIFDDQNNPPEDGASDTEEQQQQEFQVQLHGEIANVVDAVPEENRIATDYGYNTLVRTQTGRYIDKLWAGPSHWKVKFIRRSTARYSGSTVQQVVKHTRKFKTPQKIDFSRVGEDLNVEKYVPKRAPPTVAFEKITLPTPESELSFESFTKVVNHLLTKPAVPHPRLLNKNAPEQRDYEVSEYNYENLNDSQYCSQHNGDEVNNDELGQNSFEEEVPAAAQQQFLDDNLVNAPETVSSTHIPYAMQAKKMDMKKLKTAVWKYITSGDSEKSGSVVKPTLFSDMYHSLPQLLTADMKKELTSHLTVVALLHLCNENNLNLTKDKNKNDFIISQAVIA